MASSLVAIALSRFGATLKFKLLKNRRECFHGRSGDHDSGPKTDTCPGPDEHTITIYPKPFLYILSRKSIALNLIDLYV